MAGAGGGGEWGTLRGGREAEEVLDGPGEAEGAATIVGGAGDDEDGLDGVEGEAGAGDDMIEGEAGGAGVAVGEGVEEADVQVDTGGTNGDGIGGRGGDGSGGRGQPGTPYWRRMARSRLTGAPLSSS